MREPISAVAKASTTAATAATASRSKSDRNEKQSKEPNCTTAPHSLAPKKQPTAVQPRAASRSQSTKSPAAQITETKPSENASEPRKKSDAVRKENLAQDIEQYAPIEAPGPLNQTQRNISIRLLIDTMRPILEHPDRPYTPLIVDPSGRSDIFFTYAAEYSGIFVEAKKYLVEVLIKKTMTMDEAFEDLRRLVVTALKYGRILVFRMSDSATDFRKRFCDPDRFPADLLLQQGGRLFRSNENMYMRVVRPEDKEHGTFVVRDGFWVVVTSMFQPEDYQEFLAPSIPMDEMIPIVIEPAPEHGDGSQAQPGFEGFTA